MDFSGKSIPDPGFSGDDGSADVALTSALTSGAAVGEVLAALAPARLLVPVVAILGELEDTAPGELRREKSSDMAVPTITGPGGRKALPAFTSTDALARWRPDARPVPVDARRAALAAYSEGADTLLLDLAGPVAYEVTGPALRALAEGREHVAPHADPRVRGLVRDAVATEPLVSAAYLAEGTDTDLRLTLAADAAQDEVVAAARRIAARLADADALKGRLARGLDLALLPPGAPAPGEPLYTRRPGS
ncbi:SseB family protein [Yinghuangia sp. ASG 101]|uniref:SseB family protein n=1 Tax=Yinghuangia sp. ASG 101 TaxID=2896848 RepID=UPI001E3BA1C9|nr:SseB family protein [Yinghuangia sp. ASG 101]UGQ10710.1 SseB family protein [Yinghuangia sp. ASG 101]